MHKETRTFCRLLLVFIPLNLFLFLSCLKPRSGYTGKIEFWILVTLNLRMEVCSGKGRVTCLVSTDQLMTMSSYFSWPHSQRVFFLCFLFFMYLRMRKGGLSLYHSGQRNPPGIPQMDLNIWEIIRIFELLCFQDFFFFKKRHLQIKGETTFTQTLADFYS